MRRCAISIDLDELYLYQQLHGLSATQSERHPVYDIALERCLELAAELALPLTFFAVSADLARRQNVAALSRALAAGHEIGNHSRDHLYDLVRRSASEQREQVFGAVRDFERHLGITPRGFRAPGYTVNDGLLEIVAEAGHLYDSSVFPCPSYYVAKAATLLAMRLRGRRSRSMMDSPGVLSAPRYPYRVGRPYTTRGSGLWELPIQVTRGARLPYIGTALMLAGRFGARALTEFVIGEHFINLELHGIDFLDTNDGLDAIAAQQPDARIRFGEKRAILSAVVRRLRAADYRFVRLADAAEFIS
jgi:peptidoglycan/xylan/chitin deacetylase (PgdA/CDA1 family)